MSLPAARRIAVARFAADESGAVSIVMLFLLMATFTFFAITFDLTRLQTQRRYVQAQADLSALSAARRLPDEAQIRAVGKEVARRNTVFGVIEVSTEDIRPGRFSESGGFIAATPAEPAIEAVLVRLRSPFRPVLLKPFLTDESLFVTREAVVARQDIASLTLRNALLRLNSADSPLLRGLLGSQLGLNLALVSWEGLGNVDLKLRQLASLVSTRAAVQLVTFQDVLDTEISLTTLMNDLVSAGILPAGAVGAVSPLRLRLAEILTVSPEVAGLALDGTLPDIGLSVQGFLAALAQLSGAKTQHLVNVATNLSAPPLATPTLGLKVIDPGAAAIGRVSLAQPLVAKAAQVVVTVTGDLAGIVHLSLQVEAAAATARLRAVDCRASGANDIVATIEVVTQPLTLALDVTLLEKPDGKTYTDSAPVAYAGHTHQIQIRRSDLGKVVLVPNTIALSELTSALTLTIGTLKTDLNTEKNRLGLLGILVAALLSVVTGLLNSVTNLLANTALLNQAVQALLDLLGIRVAQAEVILNGFDCHMALVR